MFLRFSFILLTLLYMTGCTTSSVFTPYPLRAEAYKQALNIGNIPPALEQTKKQLNSRDRLLALLEQGRMAQLAEDYAQSKQSFEAAISLLDKIDERATLSLSNTANQSTSLISNDNIIPYESNRYEQIFLHHFQALNYLALGDKEGAQVELRRAQRLQDKSKDQYNDNSTLSEAAVGEYQSRMATMNALAQRVTSSTQNAYSLYLSGLLYESLNKWDDAFIDYKHALAIAPNNQFLQQDVWRLAVKLKRDDEVKNLKPTTKTTTPKANEGSVVILYEEGFVPAKKEIFLPFPWPQSWYVLAFPYYGDNWQSPQALSISNSFLATASNTHVVTDTQALAARALKDELVPMLIRQTLRAQTKHNMQQQANDKGGAILGILVGAYNILSENADLRSWLTLPRFAHIARFNLPEGEQTLMLNSFKPVKVSVQRNKITLLRVVKVDNHFYVASWPL